MATAKLKLNVEIGPTLRTALDVLDLSSDLLDLIPEYHYEEKQELEARVTCLMEGCVESLKRQKNGNT